jgi:hypothetical protein
VNKAGGSELTDQSCTAFTPKPHLDEDEIKRIVTRAFKRFIRVPLYFDLIAESPESALEGGGSSFLAINEQYGIHQQESPLKQQREAYYNDFITFIAVERESIL